MGSNSDKMEIGSKYDHSCPGRGNKQQTFPVSLSFFLQSLLAFQFFVSLGPRRPGGPDLYNEREALRHQSRACVCLRGVGPPSYPHVWLGSVDHLMVSVALCVTAVVAPADHTHFPSSLTHSLAYLLAGELCCSVKFITSICSWRNDEI